PVHTATLRLLHDFHDPAFHFDADYDLTLGRTQYFGFYAVGDALAFFLGVRGAMLAFVAFYFVGTLLGARSLAIALGRDERLALAVVLARYGPLVAIGLMPYLVAVPVMLWGVATLVRRAHTPSARAHVTVAVIGVALFYLHVIQLGIFLLAALVLFPWRATN